MVIVTYDEFIKFYDNASEILFNRNLLKAQSILDNKTANRWRFVEGEFKAGRVKTCLIALINTLIVNEATKSKEHSGLKSVSNDGYSETYITSAEAEKELKMSVDNIVNTHLSCTGLLGCL